ncbi:MAG: hypothetical protein HY243_14810 [Proteobacteria bacterium]|nr:hypothetical protein [Pseudomonadota bacterium]
MALTPDDFDFISNFSTLWAVIIGAVLATAGGFVATQLEWYVEGKRRQRHAALFFGEVLSTLAILLDFAKSTKGRGDPYGPITMRMLRQTRGEIELYTRNRESLYNIHNAELRARIHTMMLRLSSPIEGVFDTTQEIQAVRLQLKSTPLSGEDREELEARIVHLNELREAGFEFVMETADQIKPLIRDLQPVAAHNFERMQEIANS